MCNLVLKFMKMIDISDIVDKNSCSNYVMCLKLKCYLLSFHEVDCRVVLHIF